MCSDLVVGPTGSIVRVTVIKTGQTEVSEVRRGSCRSLTLQQLFLIRAPSSLWFEDYAVRLAELTAMNSLKAEFKVVRWGFISG